MRLLENIASKIIWDYTPSSFILMDKNGKIVKFKIDSYLARIIELNNNINIKNVSIKVLNILDIDFEKIFNETIVTKSSFSFEKIYCYDNGNFQNINISSYPLINKHNNCEGVLIIISKKLDFPSNPKKNIFSKSFCGIIGDSKEMCFIYDLIKRLANIESTVLIIGETGTGKELVAEAIHKYGQRKDKPLIKVNCSALSESLFESELFGNVKGAYTGANKNRKGRIEEAEGGTLFLDEVGEMSTNIQVKLLRFLQEKEFEKVGDSRTIKANVRIIAATNKNLKKLVEEGRFRGDLFYRLNVFTINLPPLRKRKKDIPKLTEYFLNYFKRKFNREFLSISDEVKEFFQKYYWPGNVRELKHIIEYSALMSRNGMITPYDLPENLHGYFIKKSDEKSITEKEQIIEALNSSKWHKSKAAKILGISRRTLYRKLKKFNIS